MTKEAIEQAAIKKYPVDMQPQGRTIAGGIYDFDINYGERQAFVAGATFSNDKGKWISVEDRLPEKKEGWNHSEQVAVYYPPQE